MAHWEVDAKNIGEWVCLKDKIITLIKQRDHHFRRLKAFYRENQLSVVDNTWNVGIDIDAMRNELEMIIEVNGTINEKLVKYNSIAAKLNKPKITD